MSKRIKIQSDSRDRLYFEQWQYSIAIVQSRICDIRGLDRVVTQRLIEYKSASKFLQGRYTSEVIKNIYTTLDFFINETEPFKLTLSGNWAYIYTNDDAFAKRLIAACPGVHLRYVKQAKLTQPRDAVLLNESKFAYRTYLRSMWVDDHQLTSLDSFFTAQQEQLQPCKSLKMFLKSNTAYRNHWLASHYFVDHNDPGYCLMLNLVVPRAVRKTLPIVQRINT